MRLKFVPRLPASTLPDGLRLACVLALSLMATSCRESKEARQPAAEPARAVTITSATLRPMERILLVNGTLSAQETAALSVKVPGRIESMAVDLGSVVKRGDLIAQVERRDYELRLQQARAARSEARAAVGLSPDGSDQEIAVESIATVKQARAVLNETEKNRERVLRLSREGISSKSEVDTVETAYAVALTRYESAMEEARTRLAVLAQRQADLDVAEQQLIDAAIRAPFDGAIQTRVANVGEYLQVGAPVATLVRLDPLRLRLEVPERESMHVQSGQRVQLSVDGNTNQFGGTVARVSPAISEQNRMLMVEADVPAQTGLRPGLFVRARIIVSESQPALAVPTNAVIVFAGIEKVITVEDGKARERTISTSRRLAGWVEVTSGLKSGDAVVLDPGNLRTGQPVNTTVADRSAVSVSPAVAGQTLQ